MTEHKLKVKTFPVGTLGCNCSIIYSDLTKEAIAIDPGNDSKKFLKEVADLGVTVKLLLHTHAHFDHIGESNYLRKLLKAPILLHKQDLFLYENLKQQGMFFGFELDNPEPVDQYLEDNQTFGLTGVQDQTLNNFLQTLHTPGHTPGSCCFYTELLETPQLFSGDTLFAQSIGRTDLPGGDMDKIITSIKDRLYTLPDETICIPGHGPMTRIYEEKKSNPFINLK